MDKLNNSAVPAHEGRLTFTFHAPWEKFDEKTCDGLKMVDFLVENEDCLYFIEIKDYEHPKTPVEYKTRNYKMLTDSEAAFPLEMGMKLKDSLLRYYAMSKGFTTDVKFLLLINSQELKGRERIKLFDRVAGYVPMGLDSDEYPSFSKISFEMPPIESVKEMFGFDVAVTCEV